MKKKILALTLAALLSVVMCACGNKNVDTNKGSETENDITNVILNDDSKLLFTTFDENYAKAFVVDYLNGKDVVFDENLSSEKSKVIMVGDNSKITSNTVKTMITSIADAIVSEGAVAYKINVESSDTSKIIRIYYSVEDKNEISAEDAHDHSDPNHEH